MVLVAQSLGGFTAPLVAAQLPVGMLVFVNSRMIPRPGETAEAWWGNTGAVEARVAAAETEGYSPKFDLPTYFLHDIPEAVLRDGPSNQRPQAETIFSQPCSFQRWPSIPIRVVASAHDRFFVLRVPEARRSGSAGDGPGDAYGRPSGRSFEPARGCRPACPAGAGGKGREMTKAPLCG